jgi:hypothetical protein
MQVLLMALTIISTVGTAVGALAALGIFPQREAKPPTVVIVVNGIKPGMVEPEWHALAELAARHQDELHELIEGGPIMPVLAQP